MNDFLAGKPVSSGTSSAIQGSLGAALGYAGRIQNQVPALAAALAHEASDAFLDGGHASALVGAGIALVGVVIAMIWLPARARSSDVAAQEEMYARVHHDGASSESAALPVHLAEPQIAERT
jgi:DHA2 family integral membrane protein (MFS transporter)